MDQVVFASNKDRILLLIDARGISDANLMSDSEVKMVFSLLYGENIASDAQISDLVDALSSVFHKALDGHASSSTQPGLTKVNLEDHVVVTDYSFEGAEFGNGCILDHNTFNNNGRTDGTAYVVEQDRSFRNVAFGENCKIRSNTCNGNVNFNPPASAFTMPLYTPPTW